MTKRRKGYTLIILVFAVFVLSLGLLIAVPVWQTQIQREKENELIFRGDQYVEAIRIYQMKHPGGFPHSLDEMIDEKCLRKLYKDPMTRYGRWNIILPYQGMSTKKGNALRKVLVVPHDVLSSIENSQIIGVVSPSIQKSKKIYLGQETYNKWLFFYGQSGENIPEIVYYGQEEKD